MEPFPMFPYNIETATPPSQPTEIISNTSFTPIPPIQPTPVVESNHFGVIPDQEPQIFHPPHENPPPAQTTRLRSLRTRAEPSLISPIREDPDDSSRRRSERSRRAPTRYSLNSYNTFSDSDPEDKDDQGDFEPSDGEVDKSSSSSDDEPMGRQSDDSDFETLSKRPRRQSTRKRRAPVEPAVIRRSARNVTRKSYNDSEEESEEEPVAAEAQPTEEITGDVIEKILDKRMTDITKEDGTTESVAEYYVKWKGWSHIHNSWNTSEYLKDFHGFKRVANYEKQLLLEQQFLAGATPEEIEHANILKEMEHRVSYWQKIERIVASREVVVGDSNHCETQYFVKWKGLSYDQCTWESTKDIEKHQEKIDQFLDREQQRWVKRNSGWRRSRPRIAELQEQPRFLWKGGTLRPYQLEGLNWLIQCWSNNINSILADEMGLGKTIQSISLLAWLQFEQLIPGPFLVVVPLSTIDNWMREFARWAPDMNVICYVGNSASREIIRKMEFGGTAKSKTLKINALVTTYEFILKDKSILNSYRWVYLVVDEAHRLKNSDSQLHDALSGFNTDNRLLITGTPLQNSLKELWSLLNFLHPNKFLTFAEFESKYSNLENKEAVQQLHEEIAPHLLRRYKKHVEKSLPSKTERILRVELSPMQKMYYKLILARNVQLLNRSLQGHGKVQSLINIVVELRKCCNHPYLFEGAEDTLNKSSKEISDQLIKNSGKLVLLHKLLVRLREAGHRVLIFSQMVRMLDIMADYLRSQGFLFQRLDGSMSREHRHQSMEHFNAPDSRDFCFLLSTRAGGLGINLSTADTVIIYDSDWNPQNDLQAVARAHRIGQTKVVNIYRLVSKETVEEEILERAKKKMILDHLVIQRMDSGKKVLSQVFTNEDLNSILQFGAQNLFKENSDSENQTSEDLDLDEILARAEQTEESNENEPTSAVEEFLSSFRVSTLKTTYEEDPNSSNPGKESSDSSSDFWTKLVGDQIPEESESLGPRRRTTVSSYAEHAGKSGDASDDSLLGKRGRGLPSRRTTKRQRTNCDDSPLTDGELNRFVKSLKKFASADRIEDIALDCSLAHKKTTDLAKLVREIFANCDEALENDPKASIEYQGISINAAELMQRKKDMAILESKIQGAYDTNPKSFRVNVKIKPAKFPGVTWGPKDDSMLLWGAYKYGVGNWDALKDDYALNLSTKISTSRNEPGIKGTVLIRRLESLFRAMRDEIEKRDKKPKTPKKKQPITPTRRTPSRRAKSKKAPSSPSGSDDDEDTENEMDLDEPNDDNEKDENLSQDSDDDAESMNTESDEESEAKPTKSRAQNSKQSSRGSSKQDTSMDDDDEDTEDDDVDTDDKESDSEEEPKFVVDPALLTKCKRLLKPCSNILRDMKDLDKLTKKTRILKLQEYLLEIGEVVDTAVTATRRGKEALEEHLWYKVADGTSYTKEYLRNLYKQMTDDPHSD